MEEDAKLAALAQEHIATVTSDSGTDKTNVAVTHTTVLVTCHEPGAEPEDLSSPGDVEALEHTPSPSTISVDGVKSSDDALSDDELDTMFYSLPASTPIPLQQESHLHLHDSPFSSPPSSFEPDEHFLGDHLFPQDRSSSNPSPQALRETSPEVQQTSSDQKTEPVRILPQVLDSPPSTASSPRVLGSPPSTASSPREGKLTSVMSATTEHPLGPDSSSLKKQQPPHTVRSQDPYGSFVNIERDDLFPIQEDYFTSEQREKDNTYGSSWSSSKLGRHHATKREQETRKPTAAASSFPRSSSKSSASPPRLNSGGKVPPPRPASSPKLREKLQHSRSASSQGLAEQGSTKGLVARDKPETTPSDEESVRVKLVTPLGHARPESKSSPRSISASLGDLPGEPKGTLPGQRLASTASLPAKVATEDLFPLDRELERAHPQKQAASVKKSPKFEAIPEMDPSSRRERYAASKEASVSSKQDDKFLFSDDSRLPVKASPEEPELIPELPPSYHLLLAGILYIYYSFNFIPYLSGLFAGFLLVYLVGGTAFIYFARHSEGGKEKEPKSPRLSQNFVDRMKVKFENVKVYQSGKFTATLDYDKSNHRTSDRCPTKVKLINDFTLTVRIQLPDQLNTHQVFKERVDIRLCKISLEPPEVAQNRKRRWSKKFPIRLFWPDNQTNHCVYLFSPTSRLKEDWFRRMRNAANGRTSEELMTKQKQFFAYMEKYFPSMSTPRPLHRTSRGTPPHVQPQRRQQHGKQQAYKHASLVQFSKASEDREQELSAVSITRLPPPPEYSTPDMGSHAAPRRSSRNAGTPSGSSVDRPPHPVANQRRVAATRPDPRPSNEDMGFEVIPRPPKDTDWIHALAARLCWDFWHEERWKTWVMTRIQRKLIRVKTPSFMEKLLLTDVQLGNDMPMINHLHDGPKLDLDGVWVFLDVTYRGSFVMTIETKLKLGAGRKEAEKERGKELVAIRSDRARSHPIPGRNPSPQAVSHSQAARTLGGTPVDPGDETDSGSDDEGGVSPGHRLEVEVSHLEISTSSEHGTSSSAAPPPQSHTHSSWKGSGRGARFMSVVTKITKRVANTKFVQRAAEKVSSYPLTLTVEVKQLDGILAVNIPPPPSDTIWYGFKETPRLDLVAKPKLGQKEVTLSHVTHWIEKKLCELVDKKLLLPNMEDLVIPLLNSGLPEDHYNQDSEVTSPTHPTPNQP